MVRGFLVKLKGVIGKMWYTQGKVKCKTKNEKQQFKIQNF